MVGRKSMKVYKLTFIALIGMVFIILVGMVGFHILEGLSFFDSLWMTAITVLTVGYGDFTPKTVEGKIFALIIIPFGISIVAYALGTVTAAIIEGELSKTVGRNRMERKINKLQKHIILCGLGRVGQQVAIQLQRENVPLVVIEQDGDVLEKINMDLLSIVGDATEDKVLYQAGIERAKGIISALPEDADNVMISLTAKGIKPNIQVVARAEKIESEVKLRRSGADKVINPSSIGGRRMAMSILKPISIDYVDTILHAKEEEFRIEEIFLQGSASIIGKSLGDMRIRKKYGVTIVAIKRGDTIISNPKTNEMLQEKDIVIVVGTTDQLNKFELATK